MRQYRGSLSDQWADYKYWCKTYGEIIKFTGNGPITVLKSMFKYPWVFDLLKINCTTNHLTRGLTGAPMEAIDLVCNTMAQFLISEMKDAFFDPENTVLLDVMLPPLIPRAMGLNILTPEALISVGVSTCDINSSYRYMDYMVNHGLAPDTCSFPKIASGAILSGHFPIPQCIITSNLPCDSGQASYYLMQKHYKAPMYTVDIPYNFHTPEGLDATTKDWFGAIDFLERHTGHKMDWDLLKKELEIYNKELEIELEIREMLRTPYPPLAGMVIQRNHTVHMNCNGGSELGLKSFEETLKLCKKAYAKKETGVKNLRYRAVLWNPPTMAYTSLFNWLDRCWGVAVLADMETYGNEDFLDTSSKEAMIKSVAMLSNSGPMSRHTRGPQDAYINDFNKMYEEYSADFMLVCAHMGCRNSQAMTGIYREDFKKKNRPLCIVDYELFDKRVVSRQAIRDQISNFMRNVMHAEPLDESLLVLDDENDWS